MFKPTLSNVAHTYGYVVDIKEYTFVLAFELNTCIKKQENGRTVRLRPFLCNTTT